MSPKLYLARTIIRGKSDPTRAKLEEKQELVKGLAH